jgi:hypothetical protein
MNLVISDTAGNAELPAKDQNHQRDTGVPPVRNALKVDTSMIPNPLALRVRAT